MIHLFIGPANLYEASFMARAFARHLLEEKCVPQVIITLISGILCSLLHFYPGHLAQCITHKEHSMKVNGKKKKVLCHLQLPMQSDVRKVAYDLLITYTYPLI